MEYGIIRIFFATMIPFCPDTEMEAGMANSERCKKCQFQETTHVFEPERTCNQFESEFTHLEGCPVIDCPGDCEAFMNQQAEATERQAERMSRVWFLNGPNIVMLDIGL